jgi:hypothetical protein
MILLCNSNFTQAHNFSLHACFALIARAAAAAKNYNLIILLWIHHIFTKPLRRCFFVVDVVLRGLADSRAHLLRGSRDAAAEMKESRRDVAHPCNHNDTQRNGPA